MSGIYISGIELPKDKAIAVVIHPDGTAYSAEMFSGVCTKYLKDCSAIPVPNHGRMMDLDAFYKRCEQLSEEKGESKEMTELMVEFLRFFFEKISQTPIIIPADKEDNKYIE